jgi:hypothetical protein
VLFQADFITVTELTQVALGNPGIIIYSTLHPKSWCMALTCNDQDGYPLLCLMLSVAESLETIVNELGMFWEYDKPNNHNLRFVFCSQFHRLAHWGCSYQELYLWCSRLPRMSG